MVFVTHLIYVLVFCTSSVYKKLSLHSFSLTIHLRCNTKFSLLIMFYKYFLFLFNIRYITILLRYIIIVVYIYFHHCVFLNRLFIAIYHFTFQHPCAAFFYTLVSTQPVSLYFIVSVSFIYMHFRPLYHSQHEWFHFFFD